MKITKAVTVTLLAAGCQELLALFQPSVLTQFDCLIPLLKWIPHIFQNYPKLLSELGRILFILIFSAFTTGTVWLKSNFIYGSKNHKSRFALCGLSSLDSIWQLLSLDPSVFPFSPHSALLHHWTSKASRFCPVYLNASQQWQSVRYQYHPLSLLSQEAKQLSYQLSIHTE